VEAADLARLGRPAGKPYRSIRIDGEELEFSDVFRDLHTESYAEIIAGRGFGVADVRPSIELLHRVRHDPLSAGRAGPHPLVQR
jgi:UDP-N-acetyl-2-amino-2-deoxyglucuronate dehydrogenase